MAFLLMYGGIRHKRVEFPFCVTFLQAHFHLLLSNTHYYHQREGGYGKKRKNAPHAMS